MHTSRAPLRWRFGAWKVLLFACARSQLKCVTVTKRLQGEGGDAETKKIRKDLRRVKMTPDSLDYESWEQMENKRGMQI